METIYNQLIANKEAIKNLQKGKEISFKASAEMLESTNITGLGLPSINPQNMGYIPYKGDSSGSILQYFPRIKVSSPTLVITNEVLGEGAPTAVAEGTDKPLVDFDDVVSTPTMTKYAESITISEEMLDDIDFMNEQVRTVLMRKLNNKVADQFIKSIKNATPTHTSANLTAGTTGTLVKDILPAVSADMANLGGYNLNMWLLNQPDYAKLFVEAGQNYLWYAMNNPLILNSDEVTAGNIVGVDSSMFPIYVYKELDIKIGRVGANFTNNMVTIRCESRLAWDLTGNCLNAIYNDTITGTLAAIL